MVNNNFIIINLDNHKDSEMYHHRNASFYYFFFVYYMHIQKKHIICYTHIQKNTFLCFIDDTKDFDCVEHNKLWKVLEDMGIPETT